MSAQGLEPWELCLREGSNHRLCVSLSARVRIGQACDAEAVEISAVLPVSCPKDILALRLRTKTLI